MSELQSLGVDSLHVLVPWNSLAPRPFSKRRPKGFKGSSPREYAASKWNPYDRLIRSAVDRGLRVLLTPHGPAPAWANKRGFGRRALRRGALFSYRPSAKLYGRFVQALGKRYSGSYADEHGVGVLPRVSFWSIWNEPNHTGWLRPQSTYSKALAKRIPASPHIYRKLYLAANGGLKRSGHSRDRILLGELAPVGSGHGGPIQQPLAPGAFLRELFCLDRRYRPLSGRESRARGCDRYRKIKATGFAHHPYMTARDLTPWMLPRNRDLVSIGAIKRLRRFLDRAAARGRVTRGLAIYLTEFGVQSNPPDPFDGKSLGRQATYINVAEYLAYRNPRVRAITQYAMVDDPLNRKFPKDSPRRYHGFQTGLKFEDGTAKPAYDAFRLPIYVKRIRLNKVRVWGRVRPLNGGNAGPPTIQIESRRRGNSSFSAVGVPKAITSSRGYFQETITGSGVARARWRFAWTNANGSTHYSRSAKPRRK